MGKLTIKMISPIDRGELRQLAVRLMGLPLANAYQFEEDHLVRWFIENAEVLGQVDLASKDLSLRPGIGEYVQSIQNYINGSKNAPVWPPTEEGDEAPPEETEAEAQPEETPMSEVAQEIASGEVVDVTLVKAETSEKAPEPAAEKQKKAPKIRRGGLRKSSDKDSAKQAEVTQKNLEELHTRIDTLFSELCGLTSRIDAMSEVMSTYPTVVMDDIQSLKEGLVFLINAAVMAEGDELEALSEIKDFSL